MLEHKLMNIHDMLHLLIDTFTAGSKWSTD